MGKKKKNKTYNVPPQKEDEHDIVIKINKVIKLPSKPTVVFKDKKKYSRKQKYKKDWKNN